IGSCVQVRVYGFPIRYWFTPGAVESFEKISEANALWRSKTQSRVSESNSLLRCRNTNRISRVQRTAIDRNSLHLGYRRRRIYREVSGVSDRQAAAEREPDSPGQIRNDRLASLYSLAAEQPVFASILAQIGLSCVAGN